MELWLGITLIAAFLQNVRSLLQKGLTGDLSVNGAAYVRFFYALPFAWAYGLYLWEGSPTGFNAEFFAYVFNGDISVILSMLKTAITTNNKYGYTMLDLSAS